MARRTFGDYKRAIKHVLGADPSVGINESANNTETGQLVNDALQDLCSMHPWRWRRGGPVALSLVSGQSYVELPQEFGELETITYPGSLARGMIATTLDAIQRYRANLSATPPYTYFYCILAGNVDDNAREEGLTVPTIELYPTPTEDVTDAITVSYLRQVDDLEDEGDVPQIPYWLDYPLMLLCRAKASELEDDDPNSASRVAFQAQLRSSMARDAREQRRLGLMNGGLFPKYEMGTPFYPTNIGGPSTPA